VPEITRPEVPARRSSGQGFVNLLGEVLSAGLVSLLLIAAGLFVAFVWPRPTRRVADCIRLMPVQTFGMGLLTFLIAAGLEALAGVLMIVVILVAALLISTVILIPVGLLLILLSVLVLLPVPLALAGAMAFGWVALAEVVGRAIARLLGATQMKPIGAVLVGLLITVPVTAFLWIAKPVCCAWPFIILLTSVGLGAVVHTRFGRQACDQAAGQPPREALPPEAMDDEAGEPDLPPAAGS
jgi:hypothetical protein